MHLLPGNLRVTVVRDVPPNPEGAIVLYWMVANRRLRDNPALDRAVRHARELGRPLVVVEPSRADYPWASDRMHRFVLEGMVDMAARLAGTPVVYYPYVEPEARASRGMLAALASRAVVVVTDRSPMFFLPELLGRMAADVPVRFEAVDGVGVLPVEATDRVFPTAYAFRRYVQQSVPAIAGDLLPVPDEPLDGLSAMPEATRAWLAGVQTRWPAFDVRDDLDGVLRRLPIDHGVGPALQRGGVTAAQATLDRFVAGPLWRYSEDRSHPDLDASSNLSAYLHFGHIGGRDVVRRVLAAAGWSGQCKPTAQGHREGWWGLDANVEAFLDEQLTWREVGHNAAAHLPGYDRYEMLPAWARQTLARHATDVRPVTYTLAELDAAATHDPLWNAAQRQLVTEGRLHNMLRMLWGKKILEWSVSPEAAFEAMVHLNNRYALDGRDPNSYAGICWVLGRYDRAWGPERPIFGTIRYMSSTNTARKVRVKAYLLRYAQEAWPGLPLGS